MTSCLHDPASGGSITMNRAWEVQPSGLVAKRYYFVWNRGEHDTRLEIDGVPAPLARGAILCLTPGHRVAGAVAGDDLAAISFDSLFYCVQQHDREVSCNGLLFNAASGAPVIELDDPASASFERLLDVIEEEFHIADTTQAEMLRLLLKRFIIKCTRLARRQLLNEYADALHVELVRQFSALVEKHFRTHRRVRDYAAMLHRSPKTLANAFRHAGNRSPREIIVERVTLEAKRLLHYTDRSVARIARDVGFDDPAHFSRFFKRRTGRSPVDERRGRTAQPSFTRAGKK